MFADATYLNCDLPAAQRAVADPELFFAGLQEDATVILDEVRATEGALARRAAAFPAANARLSDGR